MLYENILQVRNGNMQLQFKKLGYIYLIAIIKDRFTTEKEGGGERPLIYWL